MPGDERKVAANAGGSKDIFMQNLFFYTPRARPCKLMRAKFDLVMEKTDRK